MKTEVLNAVFISCLKYWCSRDRGGKEALVSYFYFLFFFFLRSWIPALISPIEEVWGCQEMRLSSVSLLTLGVI